MRIKPPPAVNVYVLALCGMAGLLVVRVDWWAWPIEQERLWGTYVALVTLAITAKALSLQLRVGAATSSVTFAPYLAAALMLGPFWAMSVAGVSELLAETMIRRKPAIKVAHNAAKEIIAVGIAALIYATMGGVPSPTTFDGFKVAGFVVASFAYFMLGNGATAIAVALSTQSELRDTWNEFVHKGLIQNVFSSSLAPLLAFLYTELGLLGLILVVVPLAIVRHSDQTSLRLDQANQDLLELMVKSIEARDPYTSGHSVRVATYARAIARAIGVSAKECELIEQAALLHDVGKIYEEFAPLLRKQSRLTPDERMLMRSHPVRSAELVGTISSLRGYVQSCVRYHHENVDGAGYPDGLAGDEIPLGARIIMIADTADAMTTDRPYRLALSYERLVTELEDYSGSQFDPDLVEAFKNSTQIRRLVEERIGGMDRTRPERVSRLAMTPAERPRHQRGAVPELSA